MKQLRWCVLLGLGLYAGCSGAIIDDNSLDGGAFAGASGAAIDGGSGRAGSVAQTGGGAGVGAGATAGMGAGATAGIGAGATAGVGAAGFAGGFGDTGGAAGDPGSDGCIGEAGAPSSALGGGSGGPVGLPGLGEPCTPGYNTLEAAGSPAASSVLTPPRCDEGLACNASAVCVASPACPSTLNGACTVQKGNLRAGQRVGGLAADGQRLYWVEYGTRDALCNYNHDGTLKSYDLATGARATLASGLDGPLRLGLTSTHAYVILNASPYPDYESSYHVRRVPLAGGPAEFVNDGVFVCEDCFAAAGDRAFFGLDMGAGIDTLSASSPEGALGVTGYARSLAVSEDQQTLYYSNYGIGGLNQEGYNILAVTLSSRATRVVSPIDPVQLFFPHGSQMMGVELVAGQNLILAQTPIAGGSWQAVRGLGHGMPGGSFASLRAQGSHYFIAESVGYSYSAPALLVVPTDAPATPAVRWVQRGDSDTLVWAATAHTLFWSDGYSIYAQSVDALP